MVGEHIRALKSGRWIHAIDCGDETVLHLVEDAAPRRVRRAYRPEFVAGAQSVEHVTHRERTFSPHEVVRRAYSRATDPALAAMFRDSEAFAEWCTTGRVTGARNFAVAVPDGAAAPPPTAPAPAAARAGAPVRAAAREERARAKAKPAARNGPGRRRSPRGKHGARAKGGVRAPKRSGARARTAKRPTKAAKRPAKPAGRKGTRR